MRPSQTAIRSGAGSLAEAMAATLCLSGCAGDLSYDDLRQMGLEQMIRRDYGTARNLFIEAMDKVPENPWNLYDLGDCSVYLAKEQFGLRNVPAAMNYVDDAVEYYARAINAYPGMQPALWGKNMALELKEQFEEALKVAAWAAKFVGPAARQQIFLARELEERNDPDAALLRFRQAVTMEPDNAFAHAELGRFLIRVNKRQEALRPLRTAYRLNPAEPGVLEMLHELEDAP